jgi:hypothetical protein
MDISGIDKPSALCHDKCSFSLKEGSSTHAIIMIVTKIGPRPNSKITQLHLAVHHSAVRVIHWGRRGRGSSVCRGSHYMRRVLLLLRLLLLLLLCAYSVGCAGMYDSIWMARVIAPCQTGAVCNLKRVSIVIYNAV